MNISKALALQVGFLIIYSKLGICEEGFFWHLTDLHYDPLYHVTQESCNKNLSHPGRYGSFECDAPWELVYESVRAMAHIEGGRQADFILWSGDNPPHAKNRSLLTTEVVLEITKNITETILEEFPDTLVLPVIGNHDYYPKNQLPGEENTLYSGLVQLWSGWLTSSDMKETFTKGAYFSTILKGSPGMVRAVVLNTNLYYWNNQATTGQEDPGGQIAWLEGVMGKSRREGEKVYVFYHVPFGKVYGGGNSYSSLRPDFNGRLVDILTSYSDIILGMFSAHSHQDTFKIFYNDMGEAVSSMFIPPSVTPWKSRFPNAKPHNPALRRYTFNKETFDLIDIEQYYLDLTKANSMLKADWEFLYSFKETYELENVRTGELQKLLEKMKAPHSDTFNTFFDLNTVHTQVEAEEKGCDCDCRTNHLCAIEFIHYEEFDRCYQQKEPCQNEYNDGNSLQCLTVHTFLICSLLLQFM